MAYEPSEIMFAASMLYSEKELKEYTKDAGTLRQLMIDARKKVMTSNQVLFGNSSIEKGFVDLMDENNTESLKDLAGGISASIAMKKIIGDGKPTVYMTGNVWPKDVEKFRVSAYGFEDYNSADVIVTTDKKMFYGVSLKKKRKSNAGEPTLINKAFDSVLDGKQFDDIKEQLVKIRIEYFSSLVIEAVKNGLILKEHIKDFDSLVRTTQGRKELFEAKKKDTKLFGKKSYIDTKGSAKMKKGYLDEDTRNVNSMRYFVNKKLAEKNNPLFNAFIEVMNEHADEFSDTLINIILKTKLFEELNAKDLENYKFGFYLVTGVGDVSSKGVVDVGKASVIPLETTLCGLTRIREKFKNQKPKIVVDEQKKGKTDAAKVFLQLKQGDVTLLDLEIRYKGAFTPQPQFQGTLNIQFKHLLEEECGIK